tara:strand:+ start:849 stop:1502 length:654 start_codon:yes stop_codon:yes gene_type:complete
VGKTLDDLSDACRAAHDGRYGIDAFERNREANRKKGEQWRPTKKLKMGAHTDVREEALVALVQQFTHALGVQAQVEVDRNVLRKTAQKGLEQGWSMVNELVSLSDDCPFLESITLCDGDGTPMCSLAELVDVVARLGVSADYTIDDRIRRFAEFSTLAKKISDGHGTLGEAYLIEKQKCRYIPGYYRIHYVDRQRTLEEHMEMDTDMISWEFDRDFY